MFTAPDMFDFNELYPTAVFSYPVVLDFNASLPIATLSYPLVFAFKVLTPIPVLFFPVEFAGIFPRKKVKVLYIFELEKTQKKKTYLKKLANSGSTKMTTILPPPPGSN